MPFGVQSRNPSVRCRSLAEVRQARRATVADVERDRVPSPASGARPVRAVRRPAAAMAYVGDAGRGDRRGNPVRRRAGMGDSSSRPPRLSNRCRSPSGATALACGNAARNAHPGHAVKSHMSNIPWRILKTGHPRAHLVAGAMQADQPAADSDLNKMCARVDRLVKKLEPTGAYATMIVRDISSPGVHLAFELEGDARRFGAAVNAEVSEGYPGWATQQSFLLSE